MEPRSGRRWVHLPLDEEIDHHGVCLAREVLCEKQVGVDCRDSDTCEIALPVVIDVLRDEEACARSDSVGEELPICAPRFAEPFGIPSGRTMRSVRVTGLAMMFASRKILVGPLLVEDVIVDLVARQLDKITHRLTPVPFELLVRDPVAVADLDRSDLACLDLPRDRRPGHPHRISDLFGRHHATLRRERHIFGVCDHTQLMEVPTVVASLRAGPVAGGQAGDVDGAVSDPCQFRARRL